MTQVSSGSSSYAAWHRFDNQCSFVTKPLKVPSSLSTAWALWDAPPPLKCDSCISLPVTDTQPFSIPHILVSLAFTHIWNVALWPPSLTCSFVPVLLALLPCPHIGCLSRNLAHPRLDQSPMWLFLSHSVYVSAQSYSSRQAQSLFNYSIKTQFSH